MKEPADTPRKLTVIAAFAALYLVWGSTFLGILFAIRSIPPLLMAGARFFLAGLIMFGIARWQGAVTFSLAQWRTALIVGGCLLLFGNGGVTIAEQWVPSGLASLLVATVPLDMALLGWLSGITPRPRRGIILGLAGGFIGIGILIGPALFAAPTSGSEHAVLGMLILLLGSLVWSIGSLYAKNSPGSAPPLLSSAQTMLCGGGLMLLAGLASGEGRDLDLAKITPLSLGAFVYLVLIGAIVGYTAYIWLLRHCAPAKVATYAYVNPVVAVLLGTVFAGETLTSRTIVASVIILAAVALVVTSQEAKEKIATTPRAAVARTR